MVYLLLYLILAFGSIFYDVLGKKRAKTVWFIFEWLALVLVVGLRYKVGGDTLAYHEDFDNMPKLNEFLTFDYSTSRYNVFWVFLTAVCKTVVNDFAFFQIIHALIVNTSFLCFFRRNTKRYFTATLFYGLLYYFTFNTELLRAAISVSIFLWSYKYLISKQWIKYLLCFVAAYCFHSESLIMLFLPVIHLLKEIKVNKYYFAVLVGASLIFTLFIDLTPLFGKMALVSERMSTSVEFYLDSDKAGKISALGYCKFFLFQMPWLYFLYAVRDRNLKAFLTIYYFIVFQSLHYSNILQRELDFIFPILVVAIAEAGRYAKSIQRKWRLFHRICYGLSIALILFQQVQYYILDNHWLLFLPYSSILNPVDNPLREELFYMLQHSF